jgi:Lipocalin-like domain
MRFELIFCFFLGSVLLPAERVGAATGRTELVGTWRFVSNSDIRGDGTPVKVLPEVAYEGLLIYTVDGHVSVTLMPKGRTWSNASVTDSQLRAAVLAPATTAYAGSYSVNREAGTVTHHIETSLDPSDEGRDLVRHYTLSGNTLQLSAEWQEHGETLRFRVTFKRIEK